MAHDEDLDVEVPAEAALPQDAPAPPLPEHRPRTVVLIRHGPVEDGGNCYGARVSPPLSDAAPARVAALRPRLPVTFGRVLSSPAERCLRTADLLELGEPEVDHRWLERDFGDWEGRPWAQVWQELGDVSDPERFAQLTPPDGEPWEDVRARVATALDDLTAGTAGPGEPPVAVVTHGGVIRCVLAHVLGISIGRSLLFDPAPASATWLTSWGGEGWTVARVGA